MSRSFVVFAKENGLDHSRFGVTTPRKLGNSYFRNQIKRRVREIVRTARERIPKGYDFVVNPRRSAKEKPFVEVRAELLSLLGVTL
jgi:ribonuclease P protein component